MLKVIISPAKSLDFEQNIATPKTTLPVFQAETEVLVRHLQKMKLEDIQSLMKLSLSLAELNFDRYQNWITPKEKSDLVKPAITVFTGEVYKGLDVASWRKEDFENAQEQLFILSGLYGLLRPLDLMYPYRLEMGTKMQISKDQKNLYQFWGNKLADYLNSALSQKDTLVNLASTEYSKAVPFKNIKANIITPIFKDWKGDQLKVIMMYAKHARGAMAKEIIQGNYTNLEDLKGYNVDGYMYSEAHSSGQEWVFIR
jgi:cytoplasmic iron level regulating protein YaaA (DUF328/UPF0246 family)